MADDIRQDQIPTSTAIPVDTDVLTGILTEAGLDPKTVNFTLEQIHQANAIWRATNVQSFGMSYLSGTPPMEITGLVLNEWRILGSNGGASLVEKLSKNLTFDNSGTPEEMSFEIPFDGTYLVYCANTAKHADPSGTEEFEFAVGKTPSGGSFAVEMDSIAARTLNGDNGGVLSTAIVSMVDCNNGDKVHIAARNTGSAVGLDVYSLQFVVIRVGGDPD